MLKNFFDKIKEHKMVAGIVATLVCVGIAGMTLVFSHKNIQFNIQNDTVMELEYGTETLPEITATYYKNLFDKKGTPMEVVVNQEIDYTKLGTSQLTFSAQHEDVKEEITVTMVIKDTIAPEIQLVTNPEYFTSPIAEYQEEGFSAIDNYDGDLTAQVVRTDADGIVTYVVSDSSGNETVVKRTIVYKDAVAPVITLNGSRSESITVGGSYTEAGVVAVDDCDGDITGNVVVEGTVDTQTVGTYTLVYKVSDSSGNVSEIQRTVKVKHPVSNPSDGEKTIYLTFDDGPGPYTQQLLDVLDRYGVKATFFVTGANPQYYHLIGEAHRRGHTIALHTYSHKYSIYSSLDTYYEDLQKIHDIVVEQTGEQPSIVRFPGGTSNTASKKYCTGIMTELTKDLPTKGYQYYDWNVSSEDAGSVKTEQGVIDTLINQISGRKMAIVLQHDIKLFSVEAVDNVIEWAMANGYTFKAMDENTPLIQHKAFN